MGKKVVVGMSGGVDSSVTAYLLKQQGYDVIGVTMQIWQNDKEYEEDNGSCCGLSAVDDARRVAERLDIPFYVLNFRREFEEKVIDYFVEEYKQGRTPNPCIACNRYVKWESLLQKSLQLGADYIATGHYANIVSLDNGRKSLRYDENNPKDQTYALYNLTQFQLEHTLMPVGAYSKPEIREIAKEIGLAIANKPDSQEICFVPDDDYAGFIEKRTGNSIEEGNFIDVDGNVLGRHKGIVHYTIGQRKGLGIAFGKPMYVVEIDAVNNNVVLGSNEDLFKDELVAMDINYMGEESFVEGKEYRAKIRYSHKPAKCMLKTEGDKVICTFEEKQRAITKGQSVVFYDKDIVVGGGTIC